MGQDEIKQILREFADYQHRKGRWPRGHWHELAAKSRVPVVTLCPALRDMPAFVAQNSASAPVAEPKRPEPKSRTAKSAPSAE